MNRAKCTSFVLVSLVVPVLFFGSPALAQEKKNLRIVFVSLSSNNQLPYRIAIAKGFFKDQGLSVEQISSYAADPRRSPRWYPET
jgi:ABC-type nitrate/sulfonate/bicarbonate transport system substrate-binding protein